MIERGSGRTSGLTDWRLMDMNSMWACLQDQDTTGQWKQVAGWRKICDLALAHLGRLREYRRGLAEAWPPETNAAARAYIGELDQLIDKVQRTHDAAAANYDALAAATRAIGSTRAELKPLHDEYAAKLQQKQAYEEIAADPNAVAGSRLPAQSPVTDADLERLNVQARNLMSGLSGELQQAQAMLSKPPPPPRTWPGRENLDPDTFGNSPAPLIPPIVPVPVVQTDATTRPSQTPAVSPVISERGPTVGAGPILGGAGTGLAPTPTSPNLPPVSPTSPSNGIGIGGPQTLPPISGVTGRAPSSTPLRAPSRAVTGNEAQLPHNTPPRPMPPGGLIGGTPGMGLRQPSSSSVIPPRRVNPVGGVIGGGGAGTAPSGGAGSRPGAGRTSQAGGIHGFSPAGGAPGMGPRTHGASAGPGSGQGERNEGLPRRWDPDHPWEIEEGVTPIVRPPDDQGPIDPGPTIGIDR